MFLMDIQVHQKVDLEKWIPMVRISYILNVMFYPQLLRFDRYRTRETH